MLQTHFIGIIIPFTSNLCGSHYCNCHDLTIFMHVVFKDCNRFHAGEVLPTLRSKGKNQLFDEKGVFGRVCRHDFPKSLLSVKHGER